VILGIAIEIAIEIEIGKAFDPDFDLDGSIVLHCKT
jgi:hypothetical protein